MERPLRLAVLMGTDFHGGSVDTRPLGGSESAVTHLARSLVGRGHAVTLFTFSTEASVISGVRTVPVPRVGGRVHLPSALFEAPWDAVVVKNGLFELAPVLAAHLPQGTPLWAWTGHAPDQPPMQTLLDAAIARCFERVVFVSEWQREKTLAAFRTLDARRCDVARNAIAPVFERLFEERVALVAAKAPRSADEPLRLAYTSTPYRGLDVLLHVLPEVRREAPPVVASVFSSMAIYGVAPERDAFASLYARARAAEGVRFEGPLPQAALARALRDHAVLAYPSTFAETSCIAVLEAMAAGLRVVTADLGALRETTGGAAVLVDPGPDFAARYRRALAAEVGAVRRGARWDEMFEAMGRVVATYTWRARALEWEASLRARDRVRLSA